MIAPSPAAYGLRLSGLADTRWLGVTDVGHWPSVEIVVDERVDAPQLSIDHAASVVRIRDGISHAELVHPLLSRVAGQLALASGHDAIHAGAALGAGGAWAVIGPKLAGKSTLLAALALAGTPIVADDVLVFGAGHALAGPRCIDLRPGVSHLAPGVAVRRDDPRHRIALPAIAAEHPLAGVIHLQWSDSEAAVTSLDGRAAVARLLAVHAEKGFPRRPGALLDLAALPALALARPRSMDGLAQTVALVTRVLGAPVAAAAAPRTPAMPATSASKNPSRQVVGCT